MVAELLDMIKFQHSLFALPFGLAGLLVASGGLPSPRVLVLVVACMVAARTAAMTFNRLVDERYDAENPRTRGRALPAGRVSRRAAWVLFGVSVMAFVLAAAGLNALALALSPVALAIVLGYSFAKRFTAATHLVLGLGLALAPIGAWVAATGRLGWAPLVLGLAVAAWTAGFDILYSCLDAEFDRRTGLHSLPARLGVGRALVVARLLHVGAVAAFATFGGLVGLGAAYQVAVALAAGCLVVSHVLVRPDDLSRVGIAFFHVNVVVGALILAGVLFGLFA